MFRGLLSRNRVLSPSFSARRLFSEQQVSRYQSFRPQYRQNEQAAESEFSEEMAGTEVPQKRTYSRPYSSPALSSLSSSSMAKEVPSASSAPAPSYSTSKSDVPSSTCPFPEELSQSYDIESFPGLGNEPFSPEIAKILHTPLQDHEVELKPDGAVYLPEVKYRKTLNQAFGPGGWSLIPRGPHTLNGTILSREYALFCQNRYVSQARGSSTIQGHSSSAASTEAVRSNALMRCCKDLGIASELWDKGFVRPWLDRYAIKKTQPDRYGNPKTTFTRKMMD